MDKQFIALPNYQRLTVDEMLAKSQNFYAQAATRRSVRQFSSDPIPMQVIDACIRSAGTAPSGANQQPWHFVVISDQQVKRQIRAAAEAEETAFYAGRAGETWLDTLEPLGTDAHKPFLEEAPCLIAIFEQKYQVDSSGQHIKNYYSKESTGIATGILITALHHVGLVTLTHTPSPMNFLISMLKRPVGERPFLLLVVGYPAEDVVVPDIKRKSLVDISTRY